MLPFNADVSVMLKRYVPDAADGAKVRCSMDNYLTRQNHFYLDEADEARDFWHVDYIHKTSPWVWWQQFLPVEPILAALAMKVLQISIASSPCERQLSKWAFIVTKYRTRLSLSRQHKLVYCSSNWKLAENCNSDKWYASDSSDDQE